MPFQPSDSAVHVNRPLTNISIAYMQSTEGFIADKVIPNIPVSKKSDTFFTYDRGYWNKSEAQLRAPATKVAKGGYEIGTDSYLCAKYGFGKDIPDEVIANADSPLAPEKEAAEYVARHLLHKKEEMFASTYMATNVWANEVAGANTDTTDEVVYWDDYTASTPITDVRNAMRTMQKSTGFRPNLLILTRDVKDKLLDNPNILDRLNGGATVSNPALVTDAHLAKVFDVSRIVTADAIKNTADEGQTNSHDFILSNKALLLYVAPSAGLMTPSAGYNFSWTGFRPGLNNLGVYTKRYRNEEIEAITVEGNMFFDMKVIATDLGYLFNNIIETE